MGNPNKARMLAEQVLEVDISNVKAIYAKAESLYYICDFEHAMVTYYQGLVSIDPKYCHNDFIGRNLLCIIYNTNETMHLSVLQWIRIPLELAFKIVKKQLRKL